MPRTGRPKEFDPEHVRDIGMALVVNTLRHNLEMLQARVNGHHARGDMRPFPTYLRQAVAIFEDKRVRVFLRARRSLEGQIAVSAEDCIVAMYIEGQEAEQIRKKLRTRVQNPEERVKVAAVATRYSKRLLTEYTEIDSAILRIAADDMAYSLADVMPKPQPVAKKTKTPPRAEPVDWTEDEL